MGFDAVVFMWVRSSEYINGLDPMLFESVNEWLRNDWHFDNIFYPGRE